MENNLEYKTTFPRVNGLLGVIHMYLPNKVKNLQDANSFFVEFLKTTKSNFYEENTMFSISKNGNKIQNHYVEFVGFVKSYEGSNYVKPEFPQFKRHKKYVDRNRFYPMNEFPKRMDGEYFSEQVLVFELDEKTQTVLDKDIGYYDYKSRKWVVMGESSMKLQCWCEFPNPERVFQGKKMDTYPVVKHKGYRE